MLKELQKKPKTEWTVKDQRRNSIFRKSAFTPTFLELLEKESSLDTQFLNFFTQNSNLISNFSGSDYQRQHVIFNGNKIRGSARLQFEAGKVDLVKFRLAEKNGGNTQLARPLSEFLPFAILCGTATLGALVLFVLAAAVWKTLSTQTFLLCLILALALFLRTTAWSLWGWRFGPHHIPFYIFNLIDRLAAVAFSSTLAFFACVLLKANFSTFYPEKMRLFKIVAITTAVTTFLVGAYSVAAVLIRNFVTTVFVFDAGLVVNSSFMFIAGLLVVIGCGVTLANVKGQAQLATNAKVFLGVSVFLELVFAALVVLAFVYSFVTLVSVSGAYIYLRGVSECLLAGTILVYLFFNWKPKAKDSHLEQLISEQQHEKDGYVQLQETPANYVV
jgi:hypothetical protein